MASMNYVTQEGDRIDLLADKFYGSMDGITTIVEANSDVPIDAIFPVGTILIIPIVDDETITDTSTLPPWKQ